MTKTPNNAIENKNAEDREKNPSSYFHLPEPIKQFFNKQDLDNERKRKRCILFIISGILVFSIFLIVIIAAFTQGNGGVLNFNFKGANLTEKCKVVSRSKWQAQPPTTPLISLRTPVTYVTILQTETANCTSEAQCRSLVQSIQNSQIKNQSLYDIAYNFLIGGDGEAYEGRGWQFEGLDYGLNSIGIAFIGNFTDSKPPESQILTAKSLIATGIELGYIVKNYKLLTYAPLLAPETPIALYQEIKTWKHWTVDRNSS